MNIEKLILKDRNGKLLNFIDLYIYIIDMDIQKDFKKMKNVSYVEFYEIGFVLVILVKGFFILNFVFVY